MLNLYLPEEKDELSNVVKNVDKVFYGMAVEDTELNRKLMKEIDGAEYLNQAEFIDRFGLKLSLDDISTGCKVALCIAQNPDMIFDTIECGYNARDTIILNCRNGSMIFYDMGVTIRDKCEFDTPIDVNFGGKRFNTTGSFNSWLIR